MQQSDTQVLQAELWKKKVTHLDTSIVFILRFDVHHPDLVVTGSDSINSPFIGILIAFSVFYTARYLLCSIMPILEPSIFG